MHRRTLLLAIAVLWTAMLVGVSAGHGEATLVGVASIAATWSAAHLRRTVPAGSSRVTLVPGILGATALTWILLGEPLALGDAALLRAAGLLVALVVDVAIVAVMVALLRRRTSTHPRNLALDAATAVLAMVVVVADPLLDPATGADLDAVASAVFVALAALTAVALAGILRLLCTGAQRLPAAWLLLAAAIATVAADLAFVWSGGIVGSGQLVAWGSAVLLLLAAVLDPSLSALLHPVASRYRSSPWGSVVTTVIAALAILVLLARVGAEVGGPTALTAGVLLGVVVARLFGVVVERERLLDQRQRHDQQDRALLQIGQLAVTAEGPEVFLDALATHLDVATDGQVLVLPNPPVGTGMPDGIAIGTRGARLLDLARPGTADGGVAPGFLRTVATLADAALRRFEALEALEHRSLHDELTGLPNRAQVMDRLAWVRRSLDHGSPIVTVLFVDLDGFKAVNDTFGHGVGDRILIEVADRLCAVVRASDTVGRIGGDEFVVLCPGATAAVGAQLGTRLIAALAAPFDGPDGPIQLGASVGIAEGRLDDALDALLQAADDAMYDAKREGGGRVAVTVTGAAS